MTNSFSLDKKENIIYPGIVIFEDVIDIDDIIINDLVSVKNHINDHYDTYYLNVKNTFFYGLNKINKKIFAENVQKVILNYFAKYCDIYKETSHTIQWQENIFIDIEYAGDDSFIYNPNKSFIDMNNEIKNTPFSRQVVVEILIDDNYSGGNIEWPYLEGIKFRKNKKGSIMFYPANYLFSKKHNTIMEGRRITLTTFFNGGKDFLAEENDIEEENINFLLSYMR